MSRHHLASPSLYSGLLLAFVLCPLAHITSAQDMRVYTNVSVLSEDGKPNTPLSHTLTLFHAGKVYDYMEDMGELVILEPVQTRFIILNSNYTATEVPFTVVLQFLKSADGVAQDLIQELESKADETAMRAAAAIRFQLHPEFEITRDPMGTKITLGNEMLSYEAETVSIDSRELTQQYLNYTDWAARLNYVLHPHALIPTSRLILNEELRRGNQLAVNVTLTRRYEETSRIRAEHKFSFKLQAADKQQISHWEQTLASSRVNWVSFHEYQQKLLTAVSQ